MNLLKQMFKIIHLNKCLKWFNFKGLLFCKRKRGSTDFDFDVVIFSELIIQLRKLFNVSFSPFIASFCQVSFSSLKIVGSDASKHPPNKEKMIWQNFFKDWNNFILNLVVKSLFWILEVMLHKKMKLIFQLLWNIFGSYFNHPFKKKWGLYIKCFLPWTCKIINILFLKISISQSAKKLKTDLTV